MSTNLNLPAKLVKMIKLAEKEVNDELACIAWLSHGKSFVIRNPNEFMKNILPKVFKTMKKFSTFTQKLHKWGFRQLNRSFHPNDPVVFANDYFQRDNNNLMHMMMRHSNNTPIKRNNEIGMLQRINTFSQGQNALKVPPSRNPLQGNPLQMNPLQMNP